MGRYEHPTIDGAHKRSRELGPHLYGTSPPMQKTGSWVGVLWWKHSVTSLMDKFVGIKLIKAHKGQIFE